MALSELVEDGAGEVSSENTIESLTEALDRCISNGKAHYFDKCMERAKEFELETCCQQLVDFYEKLLKESHAVASMKQA